VVTFSFMKFTHILSFPFFLGTTTIDDNQVASSTCYINHVTNNLSMFCSMVVTWFGFILHLAWHASGINVSNYIQFYAKYGGMPFRSLNVQTNTSLYSINSSFNELMFFWTNGALTLIVYGLFSRLIFMNCFSLVKIHLAICSPCNLIFLVFHLFIFDLVCGDSKS
jgi:hypothetical protein